MQANVLWDTKLGVAVCAGSPRASPKVGKPASMSADLELITQRPSAQYNGTANGPSTSMAVGKSQSSS